MVDKLETRIKVLEEQLFRMEAKVAKNRKELSNVKRLAQEALDHTTML